MAKIERIDIEGVGAGIRFSTDIIPPAGLVPILNMIESPPGTIYRYSEDGCVTFTDFNHSYESFINDLNKMVENKILTIECVLSSSMFRISDKISPSTTMYDNSIFKVFFDSDDIDVLGWSLNVLEKLFDNSVVPLYVNRENINDYTSFFSTITQIFAYIVVYARQYRNIENSDLLMKNFIEGWGIVYENIDTPQQRNFLFKNWIEQFNKRGTAKIHETGGVIEGELRRLVGYKKPNEFIFAQLAPQDIGWCLGYSSPTWYGTETVNAVSKGYDFGPSYSVDSGAGLILFDNDEVEIPQIGGKADINISTRYPWEIFLENDSVSVELRAIRGVGHLSEYPTIGTMDRKYMDGMFVFVPKGEGRVGITTETDATRSMEVYMGLDYEINVWVKKLTPGSENIEFGVNTYDENMNFVKQVSLTSLVETNSFFEGDPYQSPCNVPYIYYRLTGIVYNISESKQEDLYLNFQNGKPLRFIGDVKYLSPYIIQNRTEGVADIAIAGCTVKPLKLPFSQGYLGQKNIIAMYAQIRSARTKMDIQSFIKKYLVSYKNMVSYTWLDWVVRTTAFVTFNVMKKVDSSYIFGATVTLSNGLTSKTDKNGYVRFEINLDETLSWTVNVGKHATSGVITVNKNMIVDVLLNLPLTVSVNIIPKGFGEVQIIGECMPDSYVYIRATPKDGYLFEYFDNLTDVYSSTDNPLEYKLTTYDVEFNANFDRTGSLVFEPNETIIYPEGGVSSVNAVSTKHWVLDTITEDWVDVDPVTGDEGVTPITITID